MNIIYIILVWSNNVNFDTISSDLRLSSTELQEYNTSTVVNTLDVSNIKTWIESRQNRITYSSHLSENSWKLLLHYNY